MKKPSDSFFRKKRDTCISDTELDIVEKPSKYYVVQDPALDRSLLKCNDYYRNRTFTKALSLDDLEIHNKVWIGNYLDFCLKKRKKYVKFLYFLLKKSDFSLGKRPNEGFNGLFATDPSEPLLQWIGSIFGGFCFILVKK